jgi:hypothetical protein
MRLADFLPRNTESILTEWEAFARGITPGAAMESLALRDHAADILLATARDMGSTQNATQRAAKSEGYALHAGPPERSRRAVQNLCALNAQPDGRGHTARPWTQLNRAAGSRANRSARASAVDSTFSAWRHRKSCARAALPDTDRPAMSHSRTRCRTTAA